MEIIRFNNDYSQGAHPEVLKALNAENGSRFDAYGLDRLCLEAADLIRTAVSDKDAAVHFAVGGTQANILVLSAVLRPFESVLSADTGHIHRHETGSLEHLGHKIELLPHKDGKITAKQVQAAAQAFRDSGIPEHITEPKAVYISFPTEYGTLYSRKELEDLSAVCRSYGLYLFADGARMAYGLASEQNDLTTRSTLRSAAAAEASNDRRSLKSREYFISAHRLSRGDCGLVRARQRIYRNRADSDRAGVLFVGGVRV